MKRNETQKRPPRTWRVFTREAGAALERQVRAGVTPCCPCCGGLLEARPHTRFRDQLPLDARGFDLDCRGCRRFWCIVRHTQRSLRLLRMRRLAAAVRAVPLVETAVAARATA
jgi:hypothetical protein